MHRLWPLIAFALLAACTDAASECGSNDDCNPGYRCDHNLFPGECIREVLVQRCGATYCELPRFQCMDNACVEVNAPGPDVGPPRLDLGLGIGGEDGGDGGGSGGAGGGGPRRDAAVDDAAPNVPMPSVVIESPYENQAFINEPPVLSGEVRDLIPSGRVTYALDNGAFESDLAVDNGRFRVSLNIAPGQYTVTVAAQQGGHRDEDSVSFRVDAFAHVQNGQIYLGERPMRFVGLNAPSLREVAWYFATSGGDDRVEEVFTKARAMGATVVRTYAFDDRPDRPQAIQTARGIYNEAGLVALDQVIAKANEHGVRLLLPLVDSRDDLGGVTQYLRWGGYLVPVPADRRLFYQPGEIREHFKEYVRMILSRVNTVTRVAYKDDPTILGWEVMNGADAAGLFDAGSGGAEVADFFTDLTQLIKSIAPDQLVGTGESGFDVNPGPYARSGEMLVGAGLSGLIDGAHGVSFRLNTRIGTVDFATLHLTPDTWRFPRDPTQYANLGAEWMRGHGLIAATERKPLIVVQATLDHHQGLDLAGRRLALGAWLDEFASLELTGFVVGNFFPDAFDAAADPSAWFYREGTELSDPVNHYADLVAAAASEAGH